MKPNTLMRFSDKVDFGENCWEWKANKFPNGYGSFKLNGSNVGAHRFSYESWFGKIPAGLELDHLCRNRACVRPDHLEPVSHRENVRRSPIALAAINKKKTSCPRGHAYATENALTGKRGERYCRVCVYERHKIWICNNRDKLNASRRARYARKKQKDLLVNP